MACHEGFSKRNQTDFQIPTTGDEVKNRRNTLLLAAGIADFKEVGLFLSIVASKASIKLGIPAS
ncbi:MAG: hypothetical protein A3B68_02060 [Candidatus Melainabacteria bacterium RIFCSPHIGHO2_02_FULL_34_12]|nr:MAG: hypothetical protein A3B68_02060 [Candidatus Melainabacteria bacterium RIFCSPHIGHO2_02_FULL_34_12]